MILGWATDYSSNSTGNILFSMRTRTHVKSCPSLELSKVSRVLAVPHPGTTLDGNKSKLLWAWEDNY